jgi:hypothetical protein
MLSISGSYFSHKDRYVISGSIRAISCLSDTRHRTAATQKWRSFYCSVTKIRNKAQRVQFLQSNPQILLFKKAFSLSLNVKNEKFLFKLSSSAQFFALLLRDCVQNDEFSPQLSWTRSSRILPSVPLQNLK